MVGPMASDRPSQEGKLSPGAPNEPVTFGRYYLLGLIARGGMAEVYRAKLQVGPRRLLAIKVMRPQLAREARFVDMFHSEGKLALLLSSNRCIVENRLEHPFGRIALENPKAPGVMIDLGITSTEVGVAAPADGRKLKMVLKDDSGMRTETRSVQIEPGQRLVVKW